MFFRVHIAICDYMCYYMFNNLTNIPNYKFPQVQEQ